MRNAAVICVALLLILSGVAGFLYYGHGWHQFDPDYEGYRSIFVTSVDLSDKPEKLFYWIANQVNRLGGSYTAFRYAVLSAGIALTGASILVWGMMFKPQHAGPFYLSALVLALIPLVAENYFVRIRVGLAEPLVALALGLIFCAIQNMSPYSAPKWGVAFGSLLLLVAASLIHLQAALLIIPVTLILMGLIRFDKQYTVVLALLIGIGLTALIDWRSQFRHEVLYSKYNIVRYLLLNVGQICLLVLMNWPKVRLQKLNFFDLFLMFYTGISIGITLLLIIHPVMISGEALVRFQSVFAIIALLGSLYASPRMNLVWLYILLLNGIFFVNSLVAPFFDVKKLLT